MHCKAKILKFWNKYSQKRNIGVLVPISTFMRLWVIYIFPPSVCLFCWRKYVDRSWDCINRSQTHECGNWGWGHAIPRKGIHKWDFRCSVGKAKEAWRRRSMGNVVLLRNCVTAQKVKHKLRVAKWLERVRFQFNSRPGIHAGWAFHWATATSKWRRSFAQVNESRQYTENRSTSRHELPSWHLLVQTLSTALETQFPVSHVEECLFID